MSLTWTGRLVGRGLASTLEAGRLVPASGPGSFGFPPAGPGGLTFLSLSLRPLIWSCNDPVHGRVAWHGHPELLQPMQGF